MSEMLFAHPFDITDAREAERKAAALQFGAEEAVREAARELAQAERTYREALAKEIVRQHAAGVAWTTCDTLAKGNPNVAQLRYDRDVKAGVLDAAQQQAWRHSADRKAIGRLTDWSMRRDIQDGHGTAPEPADVQPIGRRAA